MLLSDLTGIFPCVDINVIELTDIASDKINISLIVEGNAVFQDSFDVVDGKVSVHGLGDVIYIHSMDRIAMNCNLSVSDKDNVSLSSYSFTAVACLVHTMGPVSLSDRFLSACDSYICPPGARFSVAAVGEDLIVDDDGNIASLKYKAGNLDNVVLCSDLSGRAAVYDFNLPETPGVYTLRLNGRSLTVIVADMGAPHVISCRNMFNAPEFIYINAEVSIANSRESQNAVIAGELQEYDVKTSATFEFSAKHVSYLEQQPLMLLAAAHDFHIDSVPVIMSDFKAKCSDDSLDLYECSFNARFRRNMIIFSTVDPHKIFKSPFNLTFD